MSEAALTVNEDRIAINGPISMDSAHSLMESGLAHVRSGSVTVDLANAAPIDSSAIALLLEWQRAASQAGHRLSLINFPAGFSTLADLYGVAELLPAHTNNAE